MGKGVKTQYRASEGKERERKQAPILGGGDFKAH